jgi:hypothetical protein
VANILKVLEQVCDGFSFAISEYRLVQAITGSAYN